MQEYVTDAVVLTKRDSGELDTRYALLTKRFGKMTGRAKSARKVTSKLAGHLEPGSVVKARFIEKTGTQIVDALKTAKLDVTLHDLATLATLIPEMEADGPLWDELVVRDQFSWSRILAILGWDPAGASCAGCGKSHPANFFMPRQEFFCDTCVSKLKEDDVRWVRFKE